MATPTLTVLQSTADSGHIDFLKYLRGKFNDEEAETFLSTFAATLQGKHNDFCVDLDKANDWLGYASKQKALDLLRKIKLLKDVDYCSTSRFEQHITRQIHVKTYIFEKATSCCQD